uniref:Uncharacterized protein n=1 Tax=Branchiostoma floridae TaxID=7739 RepID=C3ZAY9_BRAFL|eukprot:XP_002594015.1 hypothetical protein BRAFLDRAFT_68545 [Branchiostoma floridae]
MPVTLFSWHFGKVVDRLPPITQLVKGYRKLKNLLGDLQLQGIGPEGLQRAPGGTFYIFSPEILQIVRETYPSGDDVAWMLTNQNNRPTKEVGVDDLFEDKN